MLKVCLALLVGMALVGCEKVRTTLDLECKDNVLHYHYERKVEFPFEYVEQSDKGVAIYANNGKVITCSP